MCCSYHAEQIPGDEHRECPGSATTICLIHTIKDLRAARVCDGTAYTRQYQSNYTNIADLLVVHELIPSLPTTDTSSMLVRSLTQSLTQCS